MRTATKLLAALCGFGVVLGLLYWLVTGEVVGAILLLAFGCMPGIVVGYGLRHGAMRRHPPEDDAEADPRAQAGEVLGPFPAETVWPIFLVLGVITIGASLIYGLILLPPGAALFLLAIVGFTRESRG